MEALRTHNDNLQWEVHRLDAENRKLRSENPEASNRLDLETELEQTKLDAAGLTEQVQAYQWQLEELRERADADSETAESTEAWEDPERCALEAEARWRGELAAEIRAQAETEPSFKENDEESGAGQSREELESERAELELEFVRHNAELEATKSDAERRFAELRRDAERELELVIHNAELERYRALEAERAKWEARELRVLEQLETTRREIDKHGVGLGSEMCATLRGSAAGGH